MLSQSNISARYDKNYIQFLFKCRILKYRKTKGSKETAENEL